MKTKIRAILAIVLAVFTAFLASCSSVRPKAQAPNTNGSVSATSVAQPKKKKWFFARNDNAAQKAVASRSRSVTKPSGGSSFVPKPALPAPAGSSVNAYDSDLAAAHDLPTQPAELPTLFGGEQAEANRPTAKSLSPESQSATAESDTSATPAEETTQIQAPSELRPRGVQLDNAVPDSSATANPATTAGSATTPATASPATKGLIEINRVIGGNSVTVMVAPPVLPSKSFREAMQAAEEAEAIEAERKFLAEIEEDKRREEREAEEARTQTTAAQQAAAPTAAAPAAVSPQPQPQLEIQPQIEPQAKLEPQPQPESTPTPAPTPPTPTQSTTPPPNVATGDYINQCVDMAPLAEVVGAKKGFCFSAELSAHGFAPSEAVKLGELTVTAVSDHSVAVEILRQSDKQVVFKNHLPTAVSKTLPPLMVEGKAYLHTAYVFSDIALPVASNPETFELRVFAASDTQALILEKGAGVINYTPTQMKEMRDEVRGNRPIETAKVERFDAINAITIPKLAQAVDVGTSNDGTPPDKGPMAFITQVFSSVPGIIVFILIVAAIVMLFRRKEWRKAKLEVEIRGPRLPSVAQPPVDPAFPSARRTPDGSSRSAHSAQTDVQGDTPPPVVEKVIKLAAVVPKNPEAVKAAVASAPAIPRREPAPPPFPTELKSTDDVPPPDPSTEPDVVRVHAWEKLDEKPNEKPDKPTPFVPAGYEGRLN